MRARLEKRCNRRRYASRLCISAKCISAVSRHLEVRLQRLAVVLVASVHARDNRRHERRRLRARLERRRIGLQELVDEGLRWIVVDNGAYNDQAMEILQSQIADFKINEEYFDEGDGVIVLELAQPERIAALRELEREGLEDSDSE